MVGMWVGAAAYVDYFILLATSRTAMEQMLKICDDYGHEFNLKFSNDPNPNLSKTKCLYLFQQMEVVYPNPVKLGDHALPWVEGRACDPPWP